MRARRASVPLDDVRGTLRELMMLQAKLLARRSAAKAGGAPFAELDFLDGVTAGLREAHGLLQALIDSHDEP